MTELEQSANTQFEKPGYDMLPPQNTGYGMQHMQTTQYEQPQHTQVVMQQMPMQQIEVRWPWCHLLTSVISIFLCSCFGIPATVMSLLAYTDHNTKEFGRSQNKRNVALGLGITGIVIGSIILIIIVGVYA